MEIDTAAVERLGKSRGPIETEKQRRIEELTQENARLRDLHSESVRHVGNQENLIANLGAQLAERTQLNERLRADLAAHYGRVVALTYEREALQQETVRLRDELRTTQEFLETARNRISKDRQQLAGADAVVTAARKAVENNVMLPCVIESDLRDALTARDKLTGEDGR